MKKIALAVALALLAVIGVGGAQARPVDASSTAFADEQASCPHAGLTPPRTAFTQPRFRGPIGLEVLVVADPLVMAEAEAIMERAADAFAPHRIRLVPTFRPIPVPDLSGDADAYIAWLEQQVGGKRPAGFDVVYLALHHPIQSGGRADCVGGISSDSSAFAVGMLTASGVVGVSVEGYPLPVAPPVAEGGAKVAAHEIGHLLGAHHHYGQCGAGMDMSDPAHPCDVMFSGPKQQMGLFFGPVTGAVIRHFAFRYARG